MKKCLKCKKEKPTSEFYKNHTYKDGLQFNCKKCHFLYCKQWRKNNRESVKGYNQKWLKENPKYHQSYQKHRKSQRGYYQAHRESQQKYFNKYSKQRKATDLGFRLECHMKAVISASLRGKKAGRQWEGLVGYTAQDLIAHLEKRFDNRMSWSNYGSYWHIDHIKPKSLFKYDKPEDQEFKDCWALLNLQPLEAIANIKKGFEDFSGRRCDGR